MILPVTDPTLTSIEPPLTVTFMLNFMESRLVISILLKAVQSPSLIPLTEAEPNLADVIKPFAEASNFVPSYFFEDPSLATVEKPINE